MNIQLRDHLKHYTALNYIQKDNLSEKTEVKVDCSFGVNPFGYSKNINQHELVDHVDFQNYPPFPYHDLSDEIITFWRNVLTLKRSNITVSAGSMQVLDAINNLFLDVGDKVLGYTPQFPAYINSVRLRGGIYEGVPLNSVDKYTFNPASLLTKMKKETYKLIYIDNPNNPTGQIIPIHDIEEIIKEAKKTSTVVIIDEAYGDYMEKTNSAITLLNKYDNMFVVKSFSKGYALASMRIGYVVASESLTSTYALFDDYLLNPLGLEAATISLRDNHFIRDTIGETKRQKDKLLDSLHHFVVAKTSNRVPIFLLEHPNQNVDLLQLLQDYGIKATSGFENVQANGVRIRIPKETDQLISILKKIERQME